MRSLRWLIGLLLSLAVPGAVGAAPILFPSDGGIVDVREYGAIPDDGGDDTAAIQAALDAYPNGSRIIYLPPGLYLIRDTLKWPEAESGGDGQARTILQGAGETLSILSLPDGTAGYGDAGQPKALLWTGSAPARRFRNAVRDLTIAVGARNNGAIAMQFNATNQGTIRNVTLRAVEGSGKVGLDLGHCDEIGPLLVRGLTVEGFEIGISTKWPVNSNTFEYVTLRQQRRLGWWNYHQMIFVRRLISENRVPSLYNEKDSWGTVTLLDSHLHSYRAERGAPAILNQRQMYLRKVDLLGYERAVDNDDRGREKGDLVSPGVVVEDTSHKNLRSLFREISDGTFATAGEVVHLPVKETPAVPWGDPAKDWASLLDFGADPMGANDASEALQMAIDSGARNLYLPGGVNFLFGHSVEIRGPVQRIIGLEGRFTTEGTPLWRLVDGKHPQNLPDAPVVIIERLGNEGVGPEIRVRHESARTLVLSSATGFTVEGAGKGDLFLDDVSGHLDRLGSGQSAWCRQLSSGREGRKCQNAGGNLWILGFHAEKTGTLIETTAGGITEVNGVFLDSNSGWKEGESAFSVADATLNLFGVNERNFNRQPVTLWVRERQGAETRELAEIPWVFLGK